MKNLFFDIFKEYCAYDYIYKEDYLDILVCPYSICEYVRYVIESVKNTLEFILYEILSRKCEKYKLERYEKERKEEIIITLYYGENIRASVVNKSEEYNITIFYQGNVPIDYNYLRKEFDRVSDEIEYISERKILSDYRGKYALDIEIGVVPSVFEDIIIKSRIGEIRVSKPKNRINVVEIWIEKDKEFYVSKISLRYKDRDIITVNAFHYSDELVELVCDKIVRDFEERKKEVEGFVEKVISKVGEVGIKKEDIAEILIEGNEYISITLYGRREKKKLKEVYEKVKDDVKRKGIKNLMIFSSDNIYGDLIL